jgi:hypothetical protein
VIGHYVEGEVSRHYGTVAGRRHMHYSVAAAIALDVAGVHEKNGELENCCLRGICACLKNSYSDS